MSSTTAPTPGNLGTARRTGASESGSVALYAKRETIYQKEIQGPWQRLRAVVLFVLAGFYLLLPWLNWDGRQAVLFDLPHRKFYLFDVTFWPQDFIFLSWALMIGAFSLFFFTALAGRLWCGYACPQTVWTRFFMWIEWITEGDRNQRIRLDKAPWSVDKVLRKSAKHAWWLALSLIVGITFVGYFTPIRELVPNVFTFDLSRAERFWVVFATLALYIDNGWFREQVCKYVCPYARFQGAMFDKATLTIFYDAARGEPRGRRAKGADPKALNLGDCTDCGLCVQVCPTGIDIRKGTQYECIGCAACIDACNEVMTNVGYAKGLVRYATEEGLETGRNRILRPRLVGYAAILTVIIGTFGYFLSQRVPLRVDVIRDRARLYRETSDGRIENTYTLKIMNLDQHPHSYRIAAESLPGLTLTAPPEVHLESGQLLDVPVSVQVPPGAATKTSVPVVFDVQSTDDPETAVREKSRFLFPPKVRS